MKKASRTDPEGFGRRSRVGRVGIGFAGTERRTRRLIVAEGVTKRFGARLILDGLTSPREVVALSLGKGLFQYKATRCHNIYLAAIENEQKSPEWAAKQKWREIFRTTLPD